MYDIIFLTNIPSFYKINLYNEIAKTKKILVIYLGENSVNRNDNFIKGKMNFEYIFLNKGNYETRNKFYSSIKLIKIIKNIDYKLFLSSWETFEEILSRFVSPKLKNGLVCETSIYETVIHGWKKVIKKLIFSRNSYAFVSGSPHKKVFEVLKFKGKIIVTGGVGICNRGINSFSKIIRKEKKFLTIARLSSEKNLEFLINTFNNNKKKLTIVGSGPLEKKLKQLANSNIEFVSYVSNERIGEVYNNHDIFILPSISEPWGLVIEESLYYGVPVIVSEKVGCKAELVEKTGAGEVFVLENEEKLNDAIILMEKNYEEYIKNIKKLDFLKKDEEQVKSYYV